MQEQASTIAAVKRNICEAIKERIATLQIENQVDELCGIGCMVTTSRGERIALPSWAEVLANPSLLSRRVLSRLLVPLGLKTDVLVPIQLIDQNKATDLYAKDNPSMHGGAGKYPMDEGVSREKLAKAHVILKWMRTAL